jgi:beta-glucosidase/6-phospho-beta-glucosidase/beta-galactosidase
LDLFPALPKGSPWDALMAAFIHSQLNSLVMKRFLGGARKTASTFLGVNYYGRIRFKNLKPLVPTCGFSREELARMGVECDDMLERHPLGLESALQEMYQQCHLPIYITEHGCSSADEAFRERDLRDNLAALHRAIDRGVDVRGFYTTGRCWTTSSGSSATPKNLDCSAWISTTSSVRAR